jgi:hypothetical protein
MLVRRLITTSNIIDLQLNHEPKSAAISPNRRLKSGIASASTQLTNHNTAQMAHQLLRLRQLLLCTTSVPLHILTYMYLQATDPLTTPATTIVGSANPNAILRPVALAEPSAGELTSGPAK